MTTLDRTDILRWLTCDDAVALDELWHEADRVRREHVGDEVHLRGLIEISNHCLRQCHYCGLRAGNRDITRYRMTPDEIVAAAKQARDFHYGTVVLQAGEDEGLTLDMVSDVIRRIKGEAGVAVTLSLGERTLGELRARIAPGARRARIATCFVSRRPTRSCLCACTRRAAESDPRAWKFCALSAPSGTKWAAARCLGSQDKPTTTSPTIWSCFASWTWT